MFRNELKEKNSFIDSSIVSTKIFKSLHLPDNLKLIKNLKLI